MPTGYEIEKSFDVRRLGAPQIPPHAHSSLYLCVGELPGARRAWATEKGIAVAVGTLRARWATPEEIERWDSLVAQNPAGGDFLLTTAFAAAKRTVGWEPRFMVFDTGDALESVALILEKRIPFLGAYWYLPRSPGVDDLASLEAHLDALRTFAKSQAPSVFTVTVEPPLVDSEAHRTALRSLAPERFGDTVLGDGIQANTVTAVVDLARDDDALLASFDKKCRNMIRRAERDGVEVKEYTPDAAVFERMHHLMTLVGGGQVELRLRSKAYTEVLWNGLIEAGHARFFGIERDGEPIVMAVVFMVGDRAFYKDSGSDRTRVTPGMSNYLHWHIMRTLRDAGAVTYDLFGVAPEWATSNEEHPNYAGGKFKLSFGPRVTYVGAIDLICKPAKYRVWRRIGLRIASRLHRKRHQDFSFY